MRGRAFVIGCAALFTGCSLVLAGDLDDAHDVVIFSEGGGAADATTSDGLSEVSSRESGVEAAAPQGCKAYQPTPKFCADFDDDAGLDDWKTAEENGKPSVQSEQSFSPPSAAKVTTNDGPDACKYVRIDRQFENVGASPRATVTAKIRLQSPWPDGMIPFVFEMYPNGTNRFCSALYFIGSTDGKTDKASIDVQSDGMPNHNFELKGFPSVDEWAEIKVVLTKRPGGGAIFETTFIDPNGFSVVNTNEFPECPTWANVGVRFGPHCDHRGAAMFVDDIRVDWE